MRAAPSLSRSLLSHTHEVYSALYVVNFTLGRWELPVHLWHHLFHEFLPSEARLHRHHQRHVDLVGPGCQVLDRRAGLDGQAHLRERSRTPAAGRARGCVRRLRARRPLTFMPFSRMSLMSAPGLSAASRWKVYWLAPATAIGCTHCSGLATIMCMSAGRPRRQGGAGAAQGPAAPRGRLPKKGSWPRRRRRLSTTGCPKVMLGTKCLGAEHTALPAAPRGPSPPSLPPSRRYPSMTSRCR